MADRSVVGIHFFNYFYSFPFMLLFRAQHLFGKEFQNIAGEFVSRQALFSFRYAIGMTLFACMAFSYMLLKICGRYSPGLKTPGPGDIRFPAWIPVAGAVAGVAFYSTHGVPWFSSVSAVVWPAAVAFMAMQGIVSIGEVVSGRVRKDFFITLSFFLAILSRHAMWLFAAAGTLDALIGPGRSLRISMVIPGGADREGVSLQPMRNHTAAAVFVLLFFVLIITLAPEFGATGDGLAMPDMPDPVEANKYRLVDTGCDRTTIAGLGGVYWIDKYEYPNKYGHRPLTGVPAGKARELCAAKGGRLCSPPEWAAACAAGTEGYIYYLSRQKAGSNKLIEVNCRVAGGRGVVYSGKRKGCVNVYGLNDMMGNGWEMVEIPGTAGAVGIMGQGAGSGYDVLNQCNWLATAYENQLRVLPNIGFRCCGDVSQPSMRSSGRSADRLRSGNKP